MESTILKTPRAPSMGLARALPAGCVPALIVAAVWCTAPWPSAAAETLTLHSPPTHVNDGDTFEADLDGNGRLDLPQERVRLLYVDTPELGNARKGRNLKFGLPARAFLESALARLPIVLEFNPARKYDNYGRALALVHAGKTNVSLELIRRGHSYFDTRFKFPPDYDLFAGVEGAAFAARRGIWSTVSSRKAYLKRLRKEGKTPRAAGNDLLLKGLRPVGAIHLERRVGKFVRLKGRIVKRVFLRKGARKLLFPGSRKYGTLTVFVSGRVNRKLGVDRWPPHALVVMDGFVKRYRGSPQLVLHYGAVLPAGQR